ncbi:MAG: hypothetical protein JEZ02_01870 [Desulfatibacillum sp.]|nr:hypothetical protein [Desulfatibacillum sp.]
MNCIHIGLPKCASTSLQQNLFSKHPDIEYWGIPWKEDRITSLMACLHQHDSLDFERVDKHVELSPDKPNVISYERFSSDFNPDRKETAKRLKEVFGDSEVLLVIRNQVDQMESLYKQYLRGVPKARAWCTFNEYLEACYCRYFWEDPLMRSRYQENFSHVTTMNRLSMLRSNDLVNLYSSYFGKEHVHILVFEELKVNRQAFMEKLCRIIPMDLDKALTLINLPQKQVAMDTAAYLTKGPWGKVARLVPGPVKKILRKTNRNFNNKMHVEWPGGWRTKVADLFRDTNQELVREYGLPLKDYGYPL